MKHIPNFKIEFLVKIFMEYLNLLLIAPKKHKNIGVIYYVRALVCLTVPVGLCFCSFYTRHLYLPERYLGIFWIYLRDLMEAIGCVTMVLTYIRYFKSSAWQSLYKNINIFNDVSKYNSVKYDSKIRIIILSFVLVHPLVFYLLYLDYQKYHMEVHNSLRAIVLSATPWMHFYYVIALTTLMLVLLSQIRFELIKARNWLEKDVFNVKVSKNSFMKSQTATKHISMLFGYQLLGIFGQWTLYSVAMCLGLMGLFKPDKIYFKNLNDWQTLTVIGFTLIIGSFGPCAIAFTCDMVTAETETLLTTCYELQEKFDHQSYEYQELQSFASYISCNGIRFTAAEFFEIKRSTLLSVIATSTTYFVALVQFY